MDVDPVKADPLAVPSVPNGVEKFTYDPLAGVGGGVPPALGMPPLGLFPGALPPFAPPFAPVLFVLPGLMPPAKKKKWADAPKEFPTVGEGFPFPKGGWAYGQSVGKPYDYQKSDGYVEQMKIAAKRTTMQLAFVYLLDMQPKVAEYVQELSGEEILVVECEDAQDVAESIICRFFSVNNIKVKSTKLSQLAEMSMDAKQTCMILSDNLRSAELETPIIDALKRYVSHGGLLLSFNNAITIISKTFSGKIHPRMGATTLDKPIEIGTSQTDNNLHQHFSQYESYANAHKQIVRLHGLQRFEVVDSKNSVTTLLTETAPQSGQALVVTFQFGSGKAHGRVIHSTTSHLVSKIGAQGGTSFQPLADMLPAQSKTLAEKNIATLTQLPTPPQTTITAWNAALNCGFSPSINIALSYYPFLDSLFSMIMSHRQS